MLNCKIIIAICNKIEIACIHYKEGIIGVLPEEIEVAFTDFFQVLVRDALLVFTSPLPDVLKQTVGGHVQVHVQVGFGDGIVNDFKYLPVQLVLVVA
jgi:hypothetical protein